MRNSVAIKISKIIYTYEIGLIKRKRTYGLTYEWINLIKLMNQIFWFPQCRRISHGCKIGKRWKGMWQESTTRMTFPEPSRTEVNIEQIWLKSSTWAKSLDKEFFNLLVHFFSLLWVLDSPVFFFFNIMDFVYYESTDTFKWRKFRKFCSAMD